MAKFTNVRRFSVATITATVALSGMGFGMSPALADELPVTPDSTEVQVDGQVVADDADIATTPDAEDAETLHAATVPEVISGQPEGSTTSEPQVSADAIQSVIEDPAQAELQTGMPGQNVMVVIRQVNNGSSPHGSRAGLKFQAPSGATFANGTVTYFNYDKSGRRLGTSPLPGTSLSADRKTITVGHTNWQVPAGRQDLVVNLRLDRITPGQTVTDGLVTFESGDTYPVGTTASFGYATPDGPSQKGEANGIAGSKVRVTITHPNPTATQVGTRMVGSITAPEGTTFDSGQLSYANIPGGSNALTGGSLSADRKTLNFNSPQTLQLKSVQDISFDLRLGASVSTGDVLDGKYTFTGGDIYAAGTTADFAVNVVNPLSQSQVPTLGTGAIGQATVSINNPSLDALPAGVQFELDAPAGTTFASNNVRRSLNNGASSAFPTATLSADGKRMFVSDPNYVITAGAEMKVMFDLRSDANNSRDGVISDGRFVVNGGNALKVGMSQAVSYTAVNTIVESLNVLTPAEGGSVEPGTVTFTGEANAGAAVELRSVTTNARLGAGTANAAGEWTAVVSRPLAAGNYRIKVVSGSKEVIRAFTVKRAVVDELDVLTPAAGAEVAPGTVTFTGTANADADIELRSVATNALLGTGKAGANGSWTAAMNKALGEGNYRIKIVNGSKEVIRAFTVKRPVVATLNVLTPAAGATVAAGTVTFTGESNANATIELRSISTGALLGSDTANAAGEWSVEVNKSLVAANYKIRVVNDNVSVDRAFTAR